MQHATSTQARLAGTVSRLTGLSLTYTFATLFYHSLPCWSLQGCNYKVVCLYLEEYLNPWGIGARPGGKNILGYRAKRFLSGSPCLKSVGHKSPTVFGAILTGTEWELLARLSSFKQIFFDFILDTCGLRDIESTQMFFCVVKLSQTVFKYTSFGANSTKNRIVRTWVNLLDRNLPVGRPLNKDMFSPTSSGEEVVFNLKFEACS